MVRAGLFLIALMASVQTFAQGAPQPPSPGQVPGPAQPPRDPNAKPGTAHIRGHVLAADNGQPLRKAQVRVTSPELRENRLATTDGNGVFEIKELVAGRYNVFASKGSFVGLQYGQVRPFEGGHPLEIKEGESLDKIDFALPRGGIMTGRILDEFGEPTTDVQVMAMRYQYMQGRRRLMPAGRPALTNDIGEFRIFALPPGQYFLSATLRTTGPMDSSSDDRSGYAPTYYPGTANATEGQRIEVAVGQTITDLTMTLIQTRTARITGTAVDSAGRPFVGGFINAMQRAGFMFTGGGQIRPDGTFTLSNMAPGDYILRAMMPGAFGPGNANETATASVTINGDDINGVQLVAVKPVTVSGRIVVDPAQARSLQPSTLRLALSPANPEDAMAMMGPGGSGAVNDDLTFEAKAFPGRQLLRLNAQLAGLGWSTRSVRQNGVDVTDSGIDIRSNEDVSGIEVELTNQSTEISGLVTNGRGEPAKDYTVVIFAQDSQRWGWQSRYVSAGRPDQDGRFKVRNLPAGQYYAVALEYVEPGESSDPEFLERARERASTFSLNEGETKVLDLRIASAS